MNQSEYDLAIIGAGVAGLSAAIYAGRFKLKTIIIDNNLGGNTAIAGEIKNYPGFVSIDGYELVKTLKEQSLYNNSEFYNERVTGILKKQHCFHVATLGRSLEAHSVIFATGVRHRELGKKKERELSGKGVHYCMVCDGPVYSGKKIGVVGGGDAAVKSAALGAQYAEKVYLLVRERDINAEPANKELLNSLKDKIDILYETEVEEIVGDNKLESVALKKAQSGSHSLTLDALFIEIGAVPDASLPKSLGVDLTDKGYIKVDNMMRTNIDGIFAAGDITNFFGNFKQDITAAAMGAVAAMSVYEDHKMHGEFCTCHALPRR